MTDPLAELRDIHIPDPIAFWPPAPGWWVLVGAALLGVVGSVWLFRRWRHSAYRSAHHQFKVLRERYGSNHHEKDLVQGLSTLIRRYSMTVFGRDQVAGLTGMGWLTFLDKTGETQAFTTGVGKVLATVPYGAQDRVDGEALLQLIDQWLRKARNRKP